jgi:hypothetical protein
MNWARASERSVKVRMVTLSEVAIAEKYTRDSRPRLPAIDKFKGAVEFGPIMGFAVPQTLDMC